ncbi:MAG TPA: transposase [Terrimicrobiaceae bacterium]
MNCLTRGVMPHLDRTERKSQVLLKVMNELRNRGVGGHPDRGFDGLKGFPEDITAVFRLTSVQTCIVHLSLYSLSFGGWKERQALARD